MKILNLGSCNIDYVYRLPHIVNAGETIASSSIAQFPGGKGLNQSIAVSRAGTKIYHGGCIGEDGDYLRKIMEESGVDTTYLKTVSGKNGHAIIQVADSGQNSIFLFGGSNQMVTPEIVDDILEHFEQNDVIILQNEISSLSYIIDRAAKKKMRIILNPSPFGCNLKDIDLNNVYMIFVNEVEAACFSGDDDPEKSALYFRNKYKDLRVILTLGKNGCMYSDSQKTLYCPAFSVEAVDTTSAGDTFTGYFVSSYFGGETIESALKIACAASALSVMEKGASSSIPCIDKVKKAMNYLPLSANSLQPLQTMKKHATKL